MRNPFKTVYCEDCEHCTLTTKHQDKDSQMEFAKCKVWPKKPTKDYHRRKVARTRDSYYCSSRISSYCFNFKAKVKL